MRRAYRKELNILENVIQQEREVLIEVSDKKWEELFRKRENQEVSNMNKKFEQVEEFNRRMEALRMDFQVGDRITIFPTLLLLLLIISRNTLGKLK